MKKEENKWNILFNHLNIGTLRFLLTFIFPINPYFDYFDIKLNKTMLGIFLSGFFIIDFILYLIIIFQPEKILLFGTVFALALEWVVVHVGLWTLQNPIMFLLTSSFLIISYLIAYLYLFFNLKHYIKYILDKE